MSQARAKRKRPQSTSRRAATLVELLVVIGILAVLAALLLAGVQQARESARRAQCASNLHQIAVGCASYHEAYRFLTPGNNGYSLHVTVLPWMEQRPLWERVDFSTWGGAPESAPIYNTLVPTYACPSDTAGSAGAVARPGTSYAGNFGTGVQRYGFNGLFQRTSEFTSSFPTGLLTAAAVSDGLSSTAALAEILSGDGSSDPRRAISNTAVPLPAPTQLDLFAAVCEALQPAGPGDAWTKGRPWTDGEVGVTLYNHVLPPNRRSCYNGTAVQIGIYAPASLHPGGVNLVYGDGHGTFVSDNVDRFVWRAIGSRNGGEAASIP